MAPPAAFAETLDETLPAPPAPVRRPRLAAWIWKHDLTWRAAGALFGVSHEAARSYCHPFGDPKRRRPDAETRQRIARITRGAVPPASFDDAPSPPPVSPPGPAA